MGEKNGDCGWMNICGAINWNHNDLHVNLGISRFNNKFRLIEGGHAIDAPSHLLQSTLSAEKPFGDFVVESDFTLRHVSGQYNRESGVQRPFGESDALEFNIAAS